MGIQKSIPVIKFVNGTMVNTSEVAIVSDSEYSTNGEGTIVIRNVPSCKLTLNSKTTDHIVIKAMTEVSIIPDTGLIDEDYDELEISEGACVEFRFVGNDWYILSSDGLKWS